MMKPAARWMIAIGVAVVLGTLLWEGGRYLVAWVHQGAVAELVVVGGLTLACLGMLLLVRSDR